MMLPAKSPLVLMPDINAAPPSLQDNTADLDRLKKAIQARFNMKPIISPLFRVHETTRRFREAGFRGRAVVNNLPHAYELVDFMPADCAPGNVGMALDLGTTHLEAHLVDIEKGEVLASGNRLNEQIQNGADILSRIHFADKEEHLDILHRKAVASINKLVADLAEKARINKKDIRSLSVAGNTTMIHFLAKLNPYHLCREPYIPVANTFDPCPARHFGIEINLHAPVWICPNIGSYFGGDLIAGILASGIDQSDDIAMLIDVGTNAEVVLGNREWLIACAGAAGPALEGGVARMGMRAESGAIERAHVDGSSRGITYATIGGAPARGICGSGLIDLVAGLYIGGAIDARGRLRKKSGFPVIDSGDGPALIVVPAEKGAEGRPVLLGQIDLDAIMRSKAAMYAILSTIVGQVGLSFRDLSKIFVAGAFGRHIDPNSAIILGMIPDLPLTTYESIGNSSLSGAVAILLNEEARRRSLELAEKITYIELNVNHEFMMRFSGSRFIPHTDHALFPSVPVFSYD